MRSGVKSEGLTDIAAAAGAMRRCGRKASGRQLTLEGLRAKWTARDELENGVAVHEFS